MSIKPEMKFSLDKMIEDGNRNSTISQSDRIDRIRSLVHTNNISIPDARRQILGDLDSFSTRVGEEPLKRISVLLKSGKTISCVDYSRSTNVNNNSTIIRLGDYLIPVANIEYIHIGEEVFKDLADRA